MVKYLISVLVLLAMLLSTAPVMANAQPVDNSDGVFVPMVDGELSWESANIPAQYDISAIRPATVKFVNWLKTFPAVEFSQTFAHKSSYRADWFDGQSVGKVYGAYVWWDQFGVVHVRILMIDPPPVLNNCRTFQPDMFFVNRDGSVPEYDECYLGWYRRWQTRPELDLWYQIQQSKLMRILWEDSLREVNLSDPAVIAALQKMDLEADGMPPYASRYPVDTAELDSLVAQYSQDMTELVQVQYSGTPESINIFDVSQHGELSSVTSQDQLTTVSLDELNMLDGYMPNVSLWIALVAVFFFAVFFSLFMVFLNRRRNNFDDVRDGIDNMRRERVR